MKIDHDLVHCVSYQRGQQLNNSEKCPLNPDAEDLCNLCCEKNKQKL